VAHTKNRRPGAGEGGKKRESKRARTLTKQPIRGGVEKRKRGSAEKDWEHRSLKRVKELLEMQP